MAEPHSIPKLTIDDLKRRLPRAVLAFRGYNVTNLKRTPELLAVPEYASVVESHLKIASAVFSDVTGRRCDLLARISNQQESSLETYTEDLAYIVAIELAQVEILLNLLESDVTTFQFLMGYSLGEVTAVISARMYDYENIMRPLLSLSDDAASLANDVTMGVLFSRGPALDFSKVDRMCQQLTQETGKTICISTFLSPNTVLLLGQGNTVDLFKRQLKDEFPKGTHLRKNPNQWPPLHTSIVRQLNIPDRAAVQMERIPGGLVEPLTPVLSCVTGKVSYTETNSREILSEWIEKPQRLWRAIHTLLDEGVETIIHVGPEPNIIPATITRLSENVAAQLSQQTWSGFGLRTFSNIASRRRWLRNMISNDAALLRAPFVEQVILEDWLLEQQAN